MTALITLWSAVQTVNDAHADQLVEQAVAAGASPLDVATARRERAARIASEVQRIGAGW